MKQTDQELADIESRLRQSSDELSPVTLGKIRNIRRQAVEQSYKNNFPVINWLPVAAISVCVFATVIALNLIEPASENNPVIDELELMISADDLELYEQLEFYQWLDSNGLSS